MIVDVYHSGRERMPRPPFILMPAGVVRLPLHPESPQVDWLFWKRTPLREIAVIPAHAMEALKSDGYFIQ